MHSHVVQVDGDRGTGSSYLDGRPVRDGKSYHVVGRFDDEYIRIGGRWMFQRVVLTVHYMVEASDRWDHLIPLKRPSRRSSEREMSQDISWWRRALQSARLSIRPGRGE